MENMNQNLVKLVVQAWEKKHHTMRLLREILVKFPRKFEATTYRTLQNKPQRYQKTGSKTGEIKSLLTNF